MSPPNLHPPDETLEILFKHSERLQSHRWRRLVEPRPLHIAHAIPNQMLLLI